MAKRKKTREQEELLVDLEGAKSQAEGFVEKNSNLVFGALVALVLILGAYFVYKYMIKAPQEKAAMEQMFKAEEQFAKDSFSLALVNPGGGYKGFVDIIAEYSGTQAANVAHYYAGASYLNLGDYNVAIDYLKDYSADGNITPAMKNGMIGDAYSELEDFDSALSYYNKAVSAVENEMTAPYYLFKLGMLYEKQGDYSKSRRSFEKIKSSFPNSNEASSIDKFIARVSAKM